MVKRNLLGDFNAAGRYAKKARVSRPLKAAIAKGARQAVIKMAEHKDYITQIDEVPLSTLDQLGPNAFSSIIEIAGGERGRLGKEIMLRSARFRGIFHNNATGNQVVRLVVFYSEDEVTPTSATDVFMSANGQLGTGMGFSSHTGLNALYQPLNPSKITVLKDQLFKLGAQASVDAAQLRTYDFKINLRNAKIKYEGNTQGPGNQNRLLYIAAWAAEGADDTGVGTTVEWSGMSHVKYIDF